MIEILFTFVIPAICLIVGLLFGVLIHKKQLSKAFDQAQLESKNILEKARKEADQRVKVALREAKEESRRRRQAFDEDAKSRRAEITKLEAKIKSREQSLEKKLGIIERREKEIESLNSRLLEDEKRYKKLLDTAEENLEETRKTLEKATKMSTEEAKKELVRSLKTIAKKEAAESIRKIEEEAKEEAERKSINILSLAVQRVCSEYVNDSCISVVNLPSDEMKGRIIGREGRNIRGIEQLTGVDLIIDDTPEAVIISSFNPIRREVAKVTLERLVADGRIHPARIEETVKRVESEFDQMIREFGEQAAFDTGITDLHPELTNLLGKLRYRTCGKQSVLHHSQETAHLCSYMAGELGIPTKIAKRAGLLHDIGKAVDHDSEGHHADVGAEICAKYGESEEVVEAVRMHHTDSLPRGGNPLSVILQAANALSEQRPGARKEVLEGYVNRLTDMENLVKSFKGVEEAYVMQAGREIHTMLEPTLISDNEAVSLCNEVASRLRNEISFPGQVKITFVRESKFSDYAK